MGGKESDRMLMTVESSIGQRQGSVDEASNLSLLDSCFFLDTVISESNISCLFFMLHIGL